MASYDSDEPDMVGMSGTTVKYGVAKEGATEGSDEWEKNKERQAASHLTMAASTVSLVLALAMTAF